MGEQHAGATQRRLSNIGHWAEGGLFAALGVLALLQALGKLTGGARYIAPMPLLVGGIFLPLFLFGHSHGNTGHAHEIVKDPQQRQHLVMAVLLLVAGLAELALVAGWTTITAVAYVWPAGLAVIGVMFMVHTQHGDHAAMASAVRFHRMLGLVLLAAGIARGVQIATRTPDGPAAYVSAILVLVVAALLVTYREPEGAYTTAKTPDHGPHH